MPSGLLEILDRSERPACSRAQAMAEVAGLQGEPRQTGRAVLSLGAALSSAALSIKSDAAFTNSAQLLA
jgi:hypothetical protein